MVDIGLVSKGRFTHSVVWALIFSAAVIIGASIIARSALNLRAAVSDKPDLAIILLLPEEEITEVELMRDRGKERDYLVETKDGPKYVKMIKADGEWQVEEVEQLHEN